MGGQLSKVTDWIKSQQQTLDETLVSAGRSYFDTVLRGRPNALYDLRVANEESFRLSKGKDLCYDRPSIGLVYGLWYHARRVNTSLGLVLPTLLEAQGEEVQLYDLGAGTGAFLWAVALGCQALREEGLTPPRIRSVNIDTSPFMLHYLQHLWQALAARYDVCQEIEVECQLNTWRRQQASFPHVWLCASYLFDHENKRDDLTRDFDELIGKLQPERLFLSTSDQQKKRAFMDDIAQRLASQSYTRRCAINEHAFSGSLTAVNALRREIRDGHGIPTMRPCATWDEYSFTGYAFAQEQAGLGLGSDQNAPDHLELFQPHVADRLRIELSDDQAKAATPDGYPTVIFGPAGCGKSVVITERVRNLVEARDYSRDLRILVTTFNKELQKDVLRPWLEELLDESRCRSVNPTGTANEPCRDFYFDPPAGQRLSSPEILPNICLMHFDVLPTRLASIHKWEAAHEICSDAAALCAEAVERVYAELEEEGEDVARFEHVLDAEYVWEEFRRIYYGGLNFREDRYMTCKRPGRPILHRDKAPRQVLWRCLQAFNEQCWAAGEHTFTHRRLALCQYLRSSNEDFAFVGRKWHLPARQEIDPWLRFSHVFVDEVQDCTPADFGIFYRLLNDPNELIVGGDLAQAVHLGRTAFSNIPRLKGLDRQKRRRFRKLRGSYRLPFRVSKALFPLSRRIQIKRKGCKDRVEVSMQDPYRGSPPGARPVFVWASSTKAMAGKVKAVRQAYDQTPGDVGFHLGRCSILERDVPLRQALNDICVNAETNTILRLKGTEKTCLLWSTRRSTETREEAEEFAYTILTRGSRLLIVALFPNTCDEFKPIINTFERECIILWDWETEQHFASCTSDATFAGEYEEHDDPVWEDAPEAA